MKDDVTLERELVWEGPHLSELALTAIADGQEAIVAREALDHAEACEWCSGRLGRAALMSASVSAELARVPSLSSRARAQAPAPWRALALGVAVAVLAAMPSLPGLMGQLLGAMTFGRVFTARGVPVLVRGGFALASNESVRSMLTLATIASATLLVMMGWAIARSRSHQPAERSLS